MRVGAKKAGVASSHHVFQTKSAVRRIDITYYIEQSQAFTFFCMMYACHEVWEVMDQKVSKKYTSLCLLPLRQGEKKKKWPRHGFLWCYHSLSSINKKSRRRRPKGTSHLQPVDQSNLDICQQTCYSYQHQMKTSLPSKNKVFLPELCALYIHDNFQ